MTENQLRQKVVDIINGWINATKGSVKHREILDIYNGHKPLARGYTVKTYDAYCATTVSAAYIKAGISDYTGTECGVEEYVKIAQKKGIWEENDAHIPKLAEAVVYDWDDNGAGDDRGMGDHIGIITKTGSTSFTVTEGNMSGGKVGTREMKVNGRYIRGFICPDFAAIAKAMGGTESETVTGTEYKVGDVVSFTGSKHYTSAQAADGASCRSGKAKITQVSKGAKHPYHLIHEGSESNVYGWVDAAYIAGIASAGQTSQAVRTYTVRKGDSLWAIAAKQLGNGSRYKEIKTLNGLVDSTIYAGQILKLPQ